MTDKPLRRERPQLHIDELFAFVSSDEEGEGIISFADFHDPLRPVMNQMVGADTSRVVSLLHIAREIKKATGAKIEVIKFTNREHVMDV